MCVHLLMTVLLLLSEEIAFYNGNKREKQTIHSTFKKLVSHSSTVVTSDLRHDDTGTYKHLAEAAL